MFPHFLSSAILVQPTVVLYAASLIQSATSCSAVAVSTSSYQKEFSNG